MALARLSLKKLHQKVSSSYSAASLLGHGVSGRATGGVERQRCANNEIMRSFATAGTDKVASETSDGKDKEVSVSEPKKSRLFPRRRRRRELWRNANRDFVPALNEFFPSGLENAIMQATENMNRLFENLNISPWSLSGRVKEQDGFYKLRYDVPGLAKEDLKITVDDGVLRIRGEHKEEEDESSEDEVWSSRSYGYYDTNLVLPEDVKADEVKAELKDGVLTITIPRTEKIKKDVKEVQIH